MKKDNNNNKINIKKKKKKQNKIILITNKGGLNQKSGSEHGEVMSLWKKGERRVKITKFKIGQENQVYKHRVYFT